MTLLEKLDQIEELARAATQGGRTLESHPFRPVAEAVLVDDDGDLIAEGLTADICFFSALTPEIVLHLIAIVRKAAVLTEGRTP